MSFGGLISNARNALDTIHPEGRPDRLW